MSSSFADSFNQFSDESPIIIPDQSIDDAYLGPYAFSTDDSKPASVYASDPAELYSEIDDGPILPPPAEMEAEEGYALREWRRENAIRLEEKERREKELLSAILVEADEYKVEFHKKRQINVEANKETNREKEKAFVDSQEKFYSEADKDYWKSIAELIPKEVVSIEKRKGKKDQEKKPSAVVLQGPKPGKPTDLTRMRQILVKLKHNTPSHLKDSPTPVASIPLKAPAEAVAVV